MDDAISRFNKRKKILNNKKGMKIVHIADQSMVGSFLASPVDYQSVKEVSSNLSFKLNADLAVTDQEIHALLRTIEDKYDSEKFDNLFNACKDTVLASIAGSFGIGKIVASQDKNGGNVSTVHNAKEGVFANEEDQKNFSSYNEPFNRNNWDDKKERGKNYEKINRALDAGEVVKDDYTNGNLKKDNYDQDHVTPLSRLHSKASLHLYYSEEERKKIANAPSNLAATNSELNRNGKRAKTNFETINNQLKFRVTPHPEPA